MTFREEKSYIFKISQNNKDDTKQIKKMFVLIKNA